MSNIVYLDAFTLGQDDISWHALEACGKFKKYDRYSLDAQVSPDPEPDILIVNKVSVNEALLAHFPNTRLIVVSATGYNNVDLELCISKKITVCNVRGYSTEGVVQHVFAAIFSRFNRLEYYAEEVRKGRWQKIPDFCFYDHSITELAGKTFGVLGYGSIGKKVAEVAESFGMTVLVYNKYGSNRTLSHRIFEVELEEMFSKSDLISLHVPLNTQTKEIINESTLSLMKKNVTLINTGRGALINEAHLSGFLLQNPDSLALLDVLSEEPPSSDNPLLGVPNCFITPHIAWASRESRVRLLDGVVQNIKAFQNNAPVNTITPLY